MPFVCVFYTMHVLHFQHNVYIEVNKCVILFLRYLNTLNKTDLQDGRHLQFVFSQFCKSFNIRVTHKSNTFLTLLKHFHYYSLSRVFSIFAFSLYTILVLCSSNININSRNIFKYQKQVFESNTNAFVLLVGLSNLTCIVKS